MTAHVLKELEKVTNGPQVRLKFQKVLINFLIPPSLPTPEPYLANTDCISLQLLMVTES